MDTDTSRVALAATPADDTLEGVAAIAKWLGRTERQVFYMAETRQIPAFKLPGSRTWLMRKSVYSARVAQIETEAAGSAA